MPESKRNKMSPRSMASITQLCLQHMPTARISEEAIILTGAGWRPTMVTSADNCNSTKKPNHSWKVIYQVSRWTVDQRCSKICGRQGQLEKGHTCRQPFNWRTAIDDDKVDINAVSVNYEGMSFRNGDLNWKQLHRAVNSYSVQRFV